MKRFTQLYNSLEQTTKPHDRIEALFEYFQIADDKDKLWAIELFLNKRPRRIVTTHLLREWALEETGIPVWLFEETYRIVGDITETIAKILPHTDLSSEKYLHQWIDDIQDLKNKEEALIKNFVLIAWKSLNNEERLLFNKIITGGFRMDLSQKLISIALSKYLDLHEKTIAHRLMRNWEAKETEFKLLFQEKNALDEASKPFPFYLAYELEGNVSSLGEPEDWAAEWKWDGIRAQIIVRDCNVFIWSKGEELVTNSFPEFDALSNNEKLSFVIDGEILGFKDQRPMDIEVLQKRISKKKVSKKLKAEVPIAFMAYDLLEFNGIDFRGKSYVDRRKQLYIVVDQIQNNLSQQIILLSEQIIFKDWQALENQQKDARRFNAGGCMLKLKTSTYKTGRIRGEWWKWKVDPFIIDAVLIYATRSQGRRSSLYSDFTFAVWNGDVLVTVTKANIGLLDKDNKEIADYVKKNTIERFGPVRSVNPALVFEIAFEGISPSPRRKSGISLRFPRIIQWRRDKSAAGAGSLKDLEALL